MHKANRIGLIFNSVLIIGGGVFGIIKLNMWIGVFGIGVGIWGLKQAFFRR